MVTRDSRQSTKSKYRLVACGWLLRSSASENSINDLERVSPTGDTSILRIPLLQSLFDRSMVADATFRHKTTSKLPNNYYHTSRLKARQFFVLT